MNIYEEICKAQETAKCQIIKSQNIDIERSELADAFCSIEKLDLRVDRITINAMTYSFFRRFRNDALDPVTEAKTLKTGLVAYLWGAKVYVSRYIPDRTIFLISEKNHAITTLIYNKTIENNNLQKIMTETDQIKNNLTKSLDTIESIRQSLRQAGLSYEKQPKGNYEKLTKKRRTR